MFSPAETGLSSLLEDETVDTTDYNATPPPPVKFQMGEYNTNPYASDGSFPAG